MVITSQNEPVVVRSFYRGGVAGETRRHLHLLLILHPIKIILLLAAALLPLLEAGTLASPATPPSILGPHKLVYDTEVVVQEIYLLGWDLPDLEWGAGSLLRQVNMLLILI